METTKYYKLVKDSNKPGEFLSLYATGRWAKRYAIDAVTVSVKRPLLVFDSLTELHDWGFVGVDTEHVLECECTGVLGYVDVCYGAPDESNHDMIARFWDKFEPVGRSRSYPLGTVAVTHVKPVRIISKEEMEARVR